MAEQVSAARSRNVVPDSATTGGGRVLQRACDCGQHSIGGGQCDDCKETPLQRSAISQGGPSEIPPIVDEVLDSPGQSLDSQTRTFFEPRFNADLSRVRVHGDSRAAESAKAVNALAYTVGDHIVFGGGGSLHGSEGKRLLAHELTHVLQQRSGTGEATGIDPDPHLEAQAGAAGEAAGSDLVHPHQVQFSAAPSPAGTLQRQPASSGGGTKTGGAPFITEVRVNQANSQNVTITWSDKRTPDTDECSTGKGHCCFDAASGAAEGGACSAPRSNQVGNNCTPVGTFHVTTRIPKTSSGIEFWTQFHDSKEVALHNYDPSVDGSPRSHGCVRLHKPTAKKIFDGAREGVTKVIVENLAMPDCANPVLQAEWNRDFTTAGSKPPDGEQIDPNTGKKFTKQKRDERRKDIAETRTDLKSALGDDDKGLDTAVADIASGTATTASKIPRCVPAATVEEKETDSAEQSGFLTSAASTTATAFSAALAKTQNQSAALRIVTQFGEQLWQTATKAAQAGGAGTDDRQLYWTRLMLTQAIRTFDPKWAANADELRRLQGRLLQTLEQTSRGMTSASFSADPNLKRILVSGFDPFGFPNQGDIQQSNLSGAAALALDGTTLTDGKVSGRVESVVYPVRYQDFNEGIVENFLRPRLTGPNPPDFVMSISQGGSAFELEEFAGRRRSTPAGSGQPTDFADNLGQGGGGTPTKPVVPPGVGPGPEFIPTSASPALLSSMRQAVGRTSAITAETEVKDLPPNASQPRHLPSGPDKSPSAAGNLAVEGSGGGFLSNEIYYRNSLVRTEAGSSVPMVHLHTPMLQPGAADKTRNDLISKIKDILQASLKNI